MGDSKVVRWKYGEGGKFTESQSTTPVNRMEPVCGGVPDQQLYRTAPLFCTSTSPAGGRSHPCFSRRLLRLPAHARRKFDEALQTIPKEKRQESLAATGKCYFTRLFQLEQSLMKLMPEECYTKRLELEKTVLDVLFAWANEPAPKRHRHPPRARRCTIRGSSGPI